MWVYIKKAVLDDGVSSIKSGFCENNRVDDASQKIRFWLKFAEI